MASDWQPGMQSIASALANKRVLLTGATGLVGTYTAAKLLREVPTLSRLVLPIRAGSDGDAVARWGAVVAHERRLFEGADLAKVQVMPLECITSLAEALVTRSHEVGPIDAVAHVAADVSWD